MTSDSQGNDSAAYDQSRRVILDAAAEVFQRKGFDRATIDDIADEIGATKGRIYYYFRSKFDMFLSVYEEGMKNVHRIVEPYQNSPGTGCQRLRNMAVAHLVNLMENLGHHNAIHQGVPGQRFAALTERQRTVLEDLNGLRVEYEVMFRDVVTSGIEDGSIAPGDARLMARVFLSSLNGTALWFQRREGQTEADIRALAEDVAAALVDGYAARG